jgi:hypothetical protein
MGNTLSDAAKWVTIRRFGGFLRLGRSVLLLNTAVSAAIGATGGFAIWHDHQSTLEEHQNDMKSMGVVLAEQTSRYVQVIDLTLREVQSRIVQLNVATPADFQRQLGTQQFQSYLAERLANVPQTDAIVLNDSDGLVVNWSRAWPVARVDSSDRDFY